MLVGDELFTLKQGDKADTLEVVWLSNRCGTFQDSGKRFGLCVGQSYTF